MSLQPPPVPPIYQPEVAARAVAWAAEHPGRGLWVGLPTVHKRAPAGVAAGAAAPGTTALVGARR